MYERFLDCPNLNSGSVLKHILKRKNMSQSHLAEVSGILQQRINDFINEKRRISADTSLAIERVLGIEIKGYFYKIQSNHEIFLAAEASADKSQPDLRFLRKSIFWDTDVSKIDWHKNAKTVIQRVFEYGDDEAIREIIRFYSPEVVSSQIKNIRLTRFPEQLKELIQKYKL